MKSESRNIFFLASIHIIKLPFKRIMLIIIPSYQPDNLTTWQILLYLMGKWSLTIALICIVLIISNICFFFTIIMVWIFTYVLCLRFFLIQHKPGLSSVQTLFLINLLIDHEVKTTKSENIGPETTTVMVMFFPHPVSLILPSH